MKRRDTARSYRFRPEDVALIESLRGHLSAPVGPPIAETEILRAALRALAREHGLDETQPKKKKRVKAT